MKPMIARGRRSATVLLLLFTLMGWAQAQQPAPTVEPNHEDHEALRAMLKGATTAINEQRFADLPAYFHPQLRVTTVNQEIIVKPEGLEPYFRSWVGPGQYVKSMRISLEADELTEFYGTGDSRFGIARGKGIEDYDLKDGRHLVLPTRWTATVSKDAGGQWKIMAIHLGANFYDNPIVAQLQAALTKFGLGGLAGGLVLGALLGYLLGLRRGKKVAAK